MVPDHGLGGWRGRAAHRERPPDVNRSANGGQMRNKRRVPICAMPARAASRRAAARTACRQRREGARSSRRRVGRCREAAMDATRIGRGRRARISCVMRAGTAPSDLNCAAHCRARFGGHWPRSSGPGQREREKRIQRRGCTEKVGEAAAGRQRSSRSTGASRDVPPLSRLARRGESGGGMYSSSPTRSMTGLTSGLTSVAVEAGLTSAACEAERCAMS